MNEPRSLLVKRVLGCLRDHPHDDTPARIAGRLGFVEGESVEAALLVLGQDGLAYEASGHWQLTRNGWTVAREQNPILDDE